MNILHFSLSLLVLLSTLLSALPARANSPVISTDDAGNVIHLPQPAKRIISLAPHITELVFAAGAGTRLIGVVSYSNYPPAALSLPLVGSYNNIDLEAIAALHPDLVIAWGTGNRPVSIEKLKTLGIQVYINDPHTLDNIASSIERIAHLAGTDSTAADAATAFRIRHQALYDRYANRTKVRLFYQIWHQPLITINGTHLISEVIRLCSGENVFADLSQATPHISVEAVLTANPDVIIASGMDIARPEWLDDWKRWPNLKATRQEHLFFIPPDLLQRHTPRLLEGAAQLCSQLDRVRANSP